MLSVIMLIVVAPLKQNLFLAFRAAQALPVGPVLTAATAHKVKKEIRAEPESMVFPEYPDPKEWLVILVALD